MVSVNPAMYLTRLPQPHVTAPPIMMNQAARPSGEYGFECHPRGDLPPRESQRPTSSLRPFTHYQYGPRISTRRVPRS